MTAMPGARWPATALLAALACACGPGAAGPAGGQDQGGRGLPAIGVISYWPPADYATLPAGSVALINPNDGIVGADAATIRSYGQVVAQARARVVRLLAYVPTGYGRREAGPNSAGSPGQRLADIEAQIRAYVGAFGAANLAGIFFDEADNVDAPDPCALAATEYAALGRLVRDQGMQTAVWNPGWAGENFCYVGAALPGDAVVTFEDSLAAYQGDPDVARTLAGAASIARARGVKTWHLIHSARGTDGLKTAVALLRGRLPDFAYVTDIGGDWQRGENTWGAPPAYWDAEKRCLVDGVCP